MRGYSEAKTKQLLMNAALSSHQLTRQVLWIGGFPSPSKKQQLDFWVTDILFLQVPNHKHQPLAVSNKVKRGHSTVLPVSFGEESPHRGLQSIQILLFQFLCG